MDDDDRFDANHQDVIRRRKRLLNENKEQRQQRLHHETELYHIRQERKLEALCDQKAVKYTPPQNSNESIQTKKKRRKIIRKQFATDHVKDPLSNASKKDNDYQYSCDHKDSRTLCDCNQPPAKTTFAVMGSNGKSFASSSTSCAVYCNSQNMGSIKRTCYWNRYKQPYIQHEFSLQLDNTQDECKADDVMNAEIWINGTYAFKVRYCIHAYATINNGVLIIKHYFNPKHNKTCWGWEENIMMEVVCTGLPSEVIAQVPSLIDKQGNIRSWDCHHLYDLMSKTTTTKVEFKCITFEEFTMREGYPTYSVAKDGIHNNIMTNKYGPNWRHTWKQIEMERKKKEEEEKKRKYWMCPNGHEHCHLKTHRDMWCSSTCHDTHFYREFRVSKQSFPRCIEGHEICHDGIRQCPSCKDANMPLNPMRFKCRWCEKYFNSFSLRQFREHIILCSAGFPPYYLELQKEGRLLGPEVYDKFNKR